MKKIISKCFLECRAKGAVVARIDGTVVARVLVAACVLVLALAATAEKKAQLAELKFSVVKEDTGKPVRNASVILHPVNKDGKQESSGLQLKTDADGSAQYSGVPYGKLRIQVLAHGFQTYGEDFDINQPTHEIVIKLKRPQKQYSIYDK